MRRSEKGRRPGHELIRCREMVVDTHSGRGRFYDGLITNISKGGVFIKTSGTFSVGQDISFYFGKENMDGTIVWVHP